VDISAQRSQNIEEFRDVNVDVVVTVCGHAHETCPFFPGNSKVVHAGFNDPPQMARELAQQGASEEEQLECYRQVRDEIRAFVESLPGRLEEQGAQEP
jgi:arsenate reductase